jgi:hypothetical protein
MIITSVIGVIIGFVIYNSLMVENTSSPGDSTANTKTDGIEPPPPPPPPPPVAAAPPKIAKRPRTDFIDDPKFIDKSVHLFGREVVGAKDSEDFKVIQDLAEDLQIVNTYNREWKDFVMKEQMKHHPLDTKVTVATQESLIQLEGSGKGRLIEVALITTQFPDGRRYSFSAKVDSESGRIIETWGRRGQ